MNESGMETKFESHWPYDSKADWETASKAAIAKAEAWANKARLERIATACLPEASLSGHANWHENIAKAAVAQAKALIAELDKEQA